MWSYYGSKANMAEHYPIPKYTKLIEPFAGSARYALRHFDRDVMLVDKYEVIVKIWKWLQKCSPNDILSLPRRLNKGQTLNDFTFDCEEAKLLMGFLIKKGVERPAIKPTDWVTVQRPNFTNFSLKRIAENIWKIKHWEIIQADYRDVTNQTATWFIDPPYQFGGAAYVMNNKKIDFQELAGWCQERHGQVIVCENTKADWLPFKPMKSQKGTARTTTEGIWSNEKTAFDNEQLTLIQ